MKTHIDRPGTLRTYCGRQIDKTVKTDSPANSTCHPCTVRYANQQRYYERAGQ